MKPSLQFSVPCLDIDAEGPGPQSFQKVFYELPIGAEFPYKLSYFYIANGWCSGRGRYSQTLKILNPDGTALLNTGEQLIELDSLEKPFMIANRLQDLVFQAPGTYKVQIFLDGELVLEYPLRIIQAKSKA
ncbi:hypothetical protein IJT17_06850 [bacterium]|nr:hypothetical protein [bacterium]